MSLKKKIGIILLSIILLIITVFFFMLKYSFEHSLDGDISTEQEVMKSNLGDEFLISFKTINFPNKETTVIITDFSSGERVNFFTLHGDFKKESLETLINTKHIRCYMIYNSLIYSVDDSKYKGITINHIQKATPEEQLLFVDVAKTLVDRKEWKWIKNCSSFLLEAGDEEMKATLNRYARGQFSQEELDINRNSEIKKDEMQSIAKKIME